MKENKVYCVEGDPDYGCIFIAAKTSKEAKHIAMSSWIAEPLDNPYFEINKLGLSWWSCPKCDNEKFEILDTQTYKCKKCGKINSIPYI